MARIPIMSAQYAWILGTSILCCTFPCDKAWLANGETFPDVYTGYHTENKLHKKILEGYNPDIRPYTDKNTSISLNMSFSPLYLVDVYQTDQLVEFYAWLKQSWFDHQLTWNPNDYGGIRKIFIPATKVWLPDFAIINAHKSDQGLFHYGGYRLMVRYDGRVQLVTSGAIKTICLLNVRYYPFDEHVCHIEFDAWTLGANELQVGKADLNMNMYRINGEWEMVNQWVHKEVLQNESDGEVWFTMSFVFHLKRKPINVMLNTVIPCIVIGVLHLFMFLIPHDEGERISFGVTLMLSFSVFQIIIQGELPDTAEFLPIVDVYLSCIMYLVAISLAASILLINISRKPKTQKMPAWLRCCIRQKGKYQFSDFDEGDVRISSISKHPSPSHMYGTDTTSSYQGNYHNNIDKHGDTDTTTNYHGNHHNNIDQHGGNQGDGGDEGDWERLGNVLERVLLVVMTSSTLLVTAITMAVISTGERKGDLEHPLAGYGYHKVCKICNE